MFHISWSSGEAIYEVELLRKRSLPSAEAGSITFACLPVLLSSLEGEKAQNAALAPAI